MTTHTSQQPEQVCIVYKDKWADPLLLRPKRHFTRCMMTRERQRQDFDDAFHWHPGAFAMGARQGLVSTASWMITLLIPFNNLDEEYVRLLQTSQQAFNLEADTWAASDCKIVQIVRRLDWSERNSTILEITLEAKTFKETWDLDHAVLSED